jgi:hypothetical protein
MSRFARIIRDFLPEILAFSVGLLFLSCFTIRPEWRGMTFLLGIGSGGLAIGSLALLEVRYVIEYRLLWCFSLGLMIGFLSV